MNHLYLAATAAQQAPKWHMSGSEVTDVRIGGLVVLAGCLFGLTRSIVNWRAERATREAQAGARATAAERSYAGYETE